MGVTAIGMRGAVLQASLLALLSAGCASTQSAGTPCKLRVVAEPKNAVVYVDEYFIAPARKLADNPVALKPGKRRVTVQAPAYFPHDLEVELVPGVTTVEIALRPVPP